MLTQAAGCVSRPWLMSSGPMSGLSGKHALLTERKPSRGIFERMSRVRSVVLLGGGSLVDLELQLQGPDAPRANPKVKSGACFSVGMEGTRVPSRRQARTM